MYTPAHPFYNIKGGLHYTDMLGDGKSIEGDQLTFVYFKGMQKDIFNLTENSVPWVTVWKDFFFFSIHRAHGS